MTHQHQPFTKIIKTRATRATLPRAFTLIELMLSITLVLVLMLGVNYIFRTTTDAVGAGQTINTIARDSQSSQTLLFDDFRNASKDPPCFIIASQIVPQFLNTDDAQTGTDPTQYPPDVTPPPHPNLTGILPTVNTTEALYNYRFHRCDLLKFFTHGPYTRHTANDGAYTSSTNSDDAFITIGHALLPTYDRTMYVGPTSDVPGSSSTQINHIILANQSNNPTNASPAPTNPWSVIVEVPSTSGALNPNPLAVQRVGSYATDWVLAKNVTLLKDPNSLLTTPGQPWSSTNTYVEHNFVRQPNALQAPTAAYNGYTANMTPLGYGSLDDVSGVPTNPVSTPWPIQSSRYDLAGITPDQFRRAIADEILQWAGNATEANSGGHLWWNPLIYNCPALQPATLANATIENRTTVSPYVPYISYGSGHSPNYQFTAFKSTDSSSATLNTLTTPTGPDLARSACNPLLSTPLTSAQVAQMSPYFLQHCSQFIVEYAGDYLTQDNTTSSTAGSITALGSDGVIDYYYDANKNKRIRWYGMPRSTTNNGHIMGVLGAGTFPNRTIPVGTANDTPDVIPLRDYYAAILNDVTAAPPWEVDVNFDIPAALNAALPGDYVNPVAPGGGTGLLFAQTPSASNTAVFPSRYACAWYNDMPAMVRILIKVDDPNNKLKDGPWYEYVFKLK